MPDEPTPEQWQRTIDTLLATAERCYRLARGITDRQSIEALLRLAEALGDQVCVTAWLPIQAPADRDATECAEGRPPRTHHQSFLPRTLAGLRAPLA